MHPNYRGLAFLMSLGSLPIACARDDNESDTTTAATDPTANTGTATGTDATDPTATAPTTTTPDDTTTGPTGGMDDTTSVTTFVTDPTTTTDGTTDGQPPATDPTCIAYAAHIVECIPRNARYEDYIAQQCQTYKGYGFRADGQPCLDAFEAFYVCITNTDCAVLDSPDTCLTEDMQIMEKCPTLGGSGETTSDTQGETGVST